MVRLENVNNCRLVRVYHLSAPKGEYILIKTRAKSEVKITRRTIFCFWLIYEGIGFWKSTIFVFIITVKLSNSEFIPWKKKYPWNKKSNKKIPLSKFSEQVELLPEIFLKTSDGQITTIEELMKNGYTEIRVGHWLEHSDEPIQTITIISASCKFSTFVLIRKQQK